MSIFNCNVKYKKIVGDSYQSTKNNLVAHKFIDEYNNILDTNKFRLANSELSDYASKKLGRSVRLYTEENNKALPYREVFKELDRNNTTQKEEINNNIEILSEEQLILKNEIISTDTDILQFKESSNFDEFNTIFKLGKFSNREQYLPNNSLLKEVSGKSFNQIWDSSEYVDLQRRQILYHSIQQRISDRRNFNGRLYSKIKSQYKELDLVFIEDLKFPPIFTYNGNIFINQNFYEFFNNQKSSNYSELLDLILSEELIHSLSQRMLTKEDLSKLTYELKDKNSTYTLDIKQVYNSLSPLNFDLATIEGLRMVVQKEFFGKTTEEFRKESDNLFLETVSKVWEFILDLFKSGYSKEVVQKHIDFIKNNIETEIKPETNPEDGMLDFETCEL